MSVLTNLLLFIVILGVIVFIHEFGHFTFAKLFNVYVYEFSIGMGPKIFSHKKKGKETEYSIRAIPIGGFCSMAGEDVENDDKKIPKKRKLQGKTKLERFLIMFGGPGFNFLLAFVVLFFVGLIWGSPSSTPKISSVEKDFPAYSVGLREKDIIKKIDSHKIKTMDDVALYLAVSDHKKPIKITVEKENGQTEVYTIKTKKVEEEVNGKMTTTYKYGIGLKTEKEYGVVNALKYMVVKSGSLFRQMFVTVGYLITGKIGVKQLSGPVGIYTIVGEQAKSGLSSILYLIAYLSINVGFLNLIPLPAFDGGHILFIVIELIKGSPVKPELENTIHTVGLVLLMLLMVFITINDIIRLLS